MMPPTAPIRAVWPVLALLAGCGRPAERDGFDLDTAPALSAVEELRIGSTDDPEIGFTRPGAAHVDRDGALYVYEAADAQIRVYDAAGKPLRRIGRRGSGPGEFQGLSYFGVQGDTVWAFDTQTRRLSLFDRSGKVLVATPVAPVSVPLPNAYGLVTPLAMRPDGRFSSTMNFIQYHRGDPPTGVTHTDSMPIPRVLFAADGTVTDTIAWDEGPPPSMVPSPGSTPPTEWVQNAAGRFMVPPPPPAHPMWHALHDGRIVFHQPHPENETGVLTVTRIGLMRDTVYARRLQYRATPYTPAELDELATASARQPGGGFLMAGTGPAPRSEADPATVRAIREKMNYPRFKPAIRYSWLANDESLWLVRNPEGSSMRVIALDRDGRPRGTLDLPTGSRMLWASGDHMWVAVPDESHVPWVVRYRLESPRR